MKYKDQRFHKFQEKQGIEVGRLHRKEKRAQVRKHSDFYTICLSKSVEKEWWQCLSLYDKDRVMSSYFNQKSMIDDGRLSAETWSNYEFFDTWEEWHGFITKEFKPDLIEYRTAKLKKIGI